MSSSSADTAAVDNENTNDSTTNENTNDSTSPPNHPSDYSLPSIWTPPPNLGGKFGSINQPTAGPRTTAPLPVGKHPLQLYSLGTPNGQKVTILLEELGAEYDAWFIDIMNGDQFTSGFVNVNPNSKIPALVDTTTDPPTNMFESGSILLQLAEKFDNAFIPQEKRSEVLNWLFWQMGSAPYLGGGYGHFREYAPFKIQYAIDRFTMEVKRQLDVLEKQLALDGNTYIVGKEYTLADIAIFPWYGNLVLGKLYSDSATFLNVEVEYPHVMRWARVIADRPAVKRGLMVNKTWGDDEREQLKERHDASDFDHVERKFDDVGSSSKM